MSPDVISAVEAVLGRHPVISRFFESWTGKQLERAKKGEPYHIFLDYLASKYGDAVARQTSRFFETGLNRAPEQVPTWRRRFRQTTSQAEVESVLAEMEVGYLLLERGYKVEVEPLYPHRGPDFRVTMNGHVLYIEVKKLQRDADTEDVRRKAWADNKNPEDGTVWSRELTHDTLDNMAWNLTTGYLKDTQFPEDGLHVLFVDTFKRTFGDDAMMTAWNEIHPDSINSLILCNRQGHWLNGLAAGVQILQNPDSPVPSVVLQALRDTFSNRS